MKDGYGYSVKTDVKRWRSPEMERVLGNSQTVRSGEDEPLDGVP